MAGGGQQSAIIAPARPFLGLSLPSPLAAAPACLPPIHAASVGPASQAPATHLSTRPAHNIRCRAAMALAFPFTSFSTPPLSRTTTKKRWGTIFFFHVTPLFSSSPPAQDGGGAESAERSIILSPGVNRSERRFLPCPVPSRLLTPRRKILEPLKRAEAASFRDLGDALA